MQLKKKKKSPRDAHKLGTWASTLRVFLFLPYSPLFVIVANSYPCFPNHCHVSALLEPAEALVKSGSPVHMQQWTIRAGIYRHTLHITHLVWHDLSGASSELVLKSLLNLDWVTVTLPKMSLKTPNYCLVINPRNLKWSTCMSNLKC